MEFRHLACFLAVFDTGSFTRAAQREYMTQSGLSQQIQALERELGAALFTRRPVQPTPAALALEPSARAAVSAVANAQRVVQATTSKHVGLRLGVIASLTAVDPAALLEHVRTVHPNLSVTVTQDATDQMIDDVREGRLDLAIVHTEQLTDPQLSSCPVCEEPFALIGPSLPDGPLTATDLHRRAWIAFRKGTQLRAVFDDLMERHHMVHTIVAEVADIPLLVRLSHTGFGNAIVPAPLTAHTASTVIPANLLPPRTIRVVYATANENPALTTCLTALTQHSTPRTERLIPNSGRHQSLQPGTRR